MDRKKLVALLFGGASFVFIVLDRIATAHTLPGDLQDFWIQNMSDLAPGNYFLFAVSAGFLFWAFRSEIRELRLHAVFARFTSGRISMDEAARLLYTQVSGKVRDLYNTIWESDLFDVQLDFYAFVIVSNAEDTGEPIFARPSPKLPHEPIENDELKKLRYHYELGFIDARKSIYEKVMSRWTDAEVRREFVIEVAKQVSAENASRRAQRR